MPKLFSTLDQNGGRKVKRNHFSADLCPDILEDVRFCCVIVKKGSTGISNAGSGVLWGAPKGRLVGHLAPPLVISDVGAPDFGKGKNETCYAFDFQIFVGLAPAKTWNTQLCS